MKERLAYGGVFSFLIVILNDFSVLIYDVLSSFRLYNIQFKKVKILWGPRAGYEDWGMDNPKTRVAQLIDFNLMDCVMTLFYSKYSY